MNRTLRIRNNKLDVELTLWKLLPIFFVLLLLLISAGINGVSGISPGGSIPGFE